MSTSTGSSLVPAIFAAFESAWRVMWRPAILGPSALGTVGAFLAFRLLGTEEGVTSFSPPAMWLLGLVVSARFWLGLSVSLTTLDVLRADGRWRPFRLVDPVTAFEAAVVSLVVIPPILAGVVFLIVPGVVLALRWSQIPMLIADGRTRWFDALGSSADVVHGHKLDIFAMWLLVGVGLGLLLQLSAMGRALAQLIGVPPLVPLVSGLVLQVVTDAYSLALVGAIYHEVDRIPAEPEPVNDAAVWDGHEGRPSVGPPDVAS